MNRFRAAMTAALVMLLPLYSVHADNIRGPLKAAVDLSGGKNSSGPLMLGLEELLTIQPGKDLQFYHAVEISVELPKVFLEYGDSFAVFVYGRITEQPGSGGIAAFRGTKLLTVPFHFRQKLFIRIPFRKISSRDVSPDTVVYEGQPGPLDFPIVVTILPIMKGVPSALGETPFPVSARLLASGEGALTVRITDTQGTSLPDAKVTIGGKAVADASREQILKPGIFAIEASAPGYRTERRSVTVGEAERVALTFELIPAPVTVRFEAPKNTVIYLDGERVTQAAGAPLVIPEGRHSVIFKLDDYQVTRNFTALPGKTYKISALIDISIEEY